MRNKIKLYPGKKVRVRSIRSLESDPSIKREGNIITKFREMFYFNISGMSTYCGTTLTIQTQDSQFKKHYRAIEDNGRWIWSEWMLEESLITMLEDCLEL
jgi:hypothetical protein